MSKHTPAPWEYQGGNDFSVEINLPNDNIISIDRGCRFTDKYVMSRDELNANGRLIAAAPEMYELLKRLTPCIDDACREEIDEIANILNRIDN